MRYSALVDADAFAQNARAQRHHKPEQMLVPVTAQPDARFQSSTLK